MNRLFLVALLAAAFAAGDPLVAMVEEVDKKISLATHDIEKAMEEQVKMASEAEGWLQEQCGGSRAAVRKAVREAIAKGIEKNRTLEVFECIARRSGEGLEVLDGMKDEVGREMKKVSEKAKERAMGFHLSMENFRDYLGDLYINKMEEMHKPGSNKDKILNEAKKKLSSLESKLRDVNKKLNASKGDLKKQINDYGWKICFTLRKVRNEQTSKIKKCVP